MIRPGTSVNSPASTRAPAKCCLNWPDKLFSPPGLVIAIGMAFLCSKSNPTPCRLLRNWLISCAMNCGAITEDEAVAKSGLTLNELRSRSFVKILAQRRS